MAFYDQTFQKSSASFHWKSFDKLIECNYVLGHVEAAATLSRRAIEKEPRYLRGRLILGLVENPDSHKLWASMNDRQSRFVPDLVNDTSFKAPDINIQIDSVCNWPSLLRAFENTYSARKFRMWVALKWRLPRIWGYHRAV